MRRRDFLAAMAVGSGTLAPAGIEVIERPPIGSLSNKELDRLRNGYRKWRSAAAADDQSWEKQRVRHRQACAQGKIHDHWLFLPWHRAFIYYHERILSSYLGSPPFRLPVWDWEIDPCVPEAFVEPWPSNPLGPQHRQRAHGKTVSGADGDSIRAWLSSAAWGTFNGAADGPPPNSSAGRPHNDVHETASGDMPNSDYAAGEPLFFLHHANIDRYWIWWQNNYKFPLPDKWLDCPLGEFVDETGKLVCPTVRSVVNPVDLGYSYPDLHVPPRPIPKVQGVPPGPSLHPERVVIPDAVFARILIFGWDHDRSFVSISGSVVAPHVVPGKRYILAARIGHEDPTELGGFGQFSAGHSHPASQIAMAFPPEIVNRLHQIQRDSVGLVYRRDRPGKPWHQVKSSDLKFLVPV